MHGWIDIGWKFDADNWCYGRGIEARSTRICKSQIVKSLAVIDLYKKARSQTSIGNFTPNHIHQSKTKIEVEKFRKELLSKKLQL